MADIIIVDGYSIYHDIKRNKIVIGLPQTELTANSTIGEFQKRPEKLSNEQMTLLLTFVMYMFHCNDTGEKNETIL